MNEQLWRADLHLHTTASDGAQTPENMVRAAKVTGMNLIAITDHDTVGGLRKAIAMGNAVGLQVLSGIELSTGLTAEIHLLGYGLDPDNPQIGAFLEDQIIRRQNRSLAMLERLRLLGMPIDATEIQSDDGFMGRMNMAYAMVKRGYVNTADEAFTRYLQEGKPAFVPRERVLAAEGIRLLQSSGAVPVLAHPGRIALSTDAVLALLPEWIDAGLAGIEAYHASHSRAARDLYHGYARRHGLMVTGGSDSHGRADGVQIGDHLPDWQTMQADVTALLAYLHGKADL